MTLAGGLNSRQLPLREKLLHFNWIIALLIGLTATVGFAAQYSAGGGQLEPLALRQATRFGAGFCILFAVALVDIRFWLRWAHLFYAGGIALLLMVEFAGLVGMGARRWIHLGAFQLQPSEPMKIALVLSLARYFHGASLEDTGRVRHLLLPLVLVAVPVGLVLRQPDLGTAVMLAMTGGVMFWLAGVRLWKFGLVACAAAGAVPVIWQFLHAYQRRRILTFLAPESEPAGAGYHIMQSKIALGSGGLFGKGFLEGTQSHLNFLPEKQTDFVFTMLTEELGLVGGAVLLGLYTLLIAWGLIVSLRCQSQFGRLVALGVIFTIFLYVFVNVAMVTGLIPVVGVPLPLVSYGGTAMLTVLAGFGLVINVWIHRDVWINLRGRSAT